MNTKNDLIKNFFLFCFNFTESSAMFNAIRIKNFRTIAEANIELAPINLLYGPNLSGKTTFLQALLTARDFLIDPHKKLENNFIIPDTDVIIALSSTIGSVEVTITSNGVKFYFDYQTIRYNRRYLEFVTEIQGITFITPTNIDFQEMSRTLARNDDIYNEVNKNLPSIFNSPAPQIPMPVILNPLHTSVNWVTYILMHLFNKNTTTLLIENMETGLHPKTIWKLTKTLCEIIKGHKKQIIITTHSESLVSAFLYTLSTSFIKPEDIKCFLFTNENGKTIIKRQKVNEKGQIEGGLETFMETEFEYLKTLLGIKDE